MNVLKGLIVTGALALTVGGAQAGTCPGNVNDDNVVDFDDLLIVLSEWGCMGACDGDANLDGAVEFGDLLLVLSDWGCEETVAGLGLTGTVTNLWTSAAIEGASVCVGDETYLTAADGTYSVELFPGLYTVTFEADNYLTESKDIVLFPDLPLVVNAALEPQAAVIVSISLSGDADPDGVVTAMAEVEIFDGSTIESFAWAQTAGNDAVITGDGTDTVMVELGDLASFKAELFELLAEPPIGPDQLPPGVPLPEGEFPGGLQDRWQVVGLNHFMLEEAALIGLEVAVTTTSGTYHADDEVHTHLPFKVQTSLRNVPFDVPLLLHGKTQMNYDWSLASKPAQSSAVLTDATAQNPHFTPDWPGKYLLMVTDEATAMPVTIEIFAGNWRGVIVGQDGDGRPVASTACTGCHSNLGNDKFAAWKLSGHAEIFTNNLNTSPYWGPQCFECHTVGYNLAASNNAVDDTVDYEDFLNGGLIGNPNPNNWTEMLTEFPAAAQLSNVQCENCHGPQWALAGVGTAAHGPVQPMGEPRVSLSADVCATCHGEPLRHARFQQWQLSAHANYEVAIDEGESGSCSRCHTANGFLAWLPILLGDEPGDPLDNIEVTWTPDETHPQTCVTCHDPHNPGNVSGDNNNATVRITDNTPPLIAGFTAYGVGRGAICMTCHNSRRGLRNDDVFDQYVGTSEAARAPHGSAQTDMLMGENAYLVMTGVRGNHSFLTDTCTQCHMERTPPPADLSYNLGGTNHTFYARTDICSDCHGDALEADFIQGGVHDTLDILQGLIEDSIVDLMAEVIAGSNTIDLNGDVVVTDVNSIQDVEFGEYRGRQSITVTFTDQSVLGPYRMTDIDVVNNSMVVIGQLYDFADEGLIKAGWNWGLVHNDGSFGIHNPSYAWLVMGEAIDALAPPGAAPLFSYPSWFDKRYAPDRD